MFWKFLMPILIMVAVSLLLAGASYNYDDHKSKREMATEVAEEAAEAAKAALDAQLEAGEEASQQVKQMLSDSAHLAAQGALEVLDIKKQLVDLLAERLEDNQHAIESAERTIDATMCSLERILWIRDSICEGLENMLHLYEEAHCTQEDIEELVAFAEHEVQEKEELLRDALVRLDDLKSSMKENAMKENAMKENAMKENSKKANSAVEKSMAIEKINLLDKLVPKIAKLKGVDLQRVKEFLFMHRKGAKHQSN